MVEDNLIIKKSGVPHLPFNIIDENGNVIADLFHNLQSVSYARLFKNAPRMHKILWDVLANYSVSINDNTISDKDLKILKDISELQVELLEPIGARTETTLQDEVLEKNIDEPLARIFVNPQSKEYFGEKKNSDT